MHFKYFFFGFPGGSVVHAHTHAYADFWAPCVLKSLFGNWPASSAVPKYFCSGSTTFPMNARSEQCNKSNFFFLSAPAPSLPHLMWPKLQNWNSLMIVFVAPYPTGWAGSNSTTIGTEFRSRSSFCMQHNYVNTTEMKKKKQIVIRHGVSYI